MTPTSIEGEEGGLCAALLDAQADDVLLLKIRESRCHGIEEEKRPDTQEVGRAECVQHAREHGTANRSLVAFPLLIFGLLALGLTQAWRQLGEARNREHRRLQKQGGSYQQKSGRHIKRQRRGDRGAEERAESGAGGDEAEEAFALLGAEEIDVELPEHRDDEEIVDRHPDEEDSADPDRLLRDRRHAGPRRTAGCWPRRTGR